MQNISKDNQEWASLKPDVIFHIGEVSGDYPSSEIFKRVSEVWRISVDGEIRDRGGKLNYVYEGSEISFFNKLIEVNAENSYWSKWKETLLCFN